MVYPALLPLMRTSRLPVVDWTDAPADLNGHVRFAERLNLVSARVPSHFNWPLPPCVWISYCLELYPEVGGSRILWNDCVHLPFALTHTSAVWIIDARNSHVARTYSFCFSFLVSVDTVFRFARSFYGWCSLPTCSLSLWSVDRCSPTASKSHGCRNKRNAA